MTYKIEFSKRAEKQLRSLPRDVQETITPKIDALAEEPRPSDCKKMVGMDNTYRIRVGNYRAIYEVRDRVLLIFVVQIGHRREVYRKN